jgi:predicted polyphosphate/ATP-dependent NAD kinase
LALVGIVANPAAGKDIRRLVAQGRFVPNHEKVNVLKRVLAGLDAVGVERVLFMPDSGMLGRGALDGSTFDLDCQFVDMPVFHEDVDSSTATRLIREAGAGCIVTLGGDGTNRVVAKESGDVPILPISTGTNNVFPTTVEGTIAGMAAGLVATGAVDTDVVTLRGNRLELVIDGELSDIALVDLAVSTERFVGSRAIWDIETLEEVFLCRSDPSSIGLSSIGAQLKPLVPGSTEGIRVRFGPGGESVLAAVAPGIVQTVRIRSWEVMSPGQSITVSSRPATIALDGERTLTLTDAAVAEVVLSPDGPPVVDIGATMRMAAQAGYFRSGAPSHARLSTAGPEQAE